MGELHKPVHEALDKIVAKMIAKTGMLPSKTTVAELLAWSAKELAEPDPVGLEELRERITIYSSGPVSMSVCADADVTREQLSCSRMRNSRRGFLRAGRSAMIKLSKGESQCRALASRVQASFTGC